jgi:hypothetical protein
LKLRNKVLLHVALFHEELPRDPLLGPGCRGWVIKFNEYGRGFCSVSNLKELRRDVVEFNQVDRGLFCALHPEKLRR